MMTIDDFVIEVRLAYAAHQRLLRLGFRAEDIFTGVNHERVLVTLKLPGSDPFNIVCCKTAMTAEQYEAAWRVFVDAVQVQKVVPQAVLDEMCAEWPFGDVHLVHALQEKGLLPHMRAAVS